MVKGRHITESKVKHMLRDDLVIIAHSAKFDRPKFESLFPGDDHRWTCSLDYYDWPKFGTKKLEILLHLEGFFFDAHRAYLDCLALAFMMHRVPECLTEILRPQVRISAVGSPF